MAPKAIDDYETDLKYTPISLFNPIDDPKNKKFQLREHVGGIPEDSDN